MMRSLLLKLSSKKNISFQSFLQIKEISKLMRSLGILLKNPKRARRWYLSHKKMNKVCSWLERKHLPLQLKRNQLLVKESVQSILILQIQMIWFYQLKLRKTTENTLIQAHKSIYLQLESMNKQLITSLMKSYQWCALVIYTKAKCFQSENLI